MFSLLHQYLINCSSVALPGIGTLQFSNTPAQTMSDGQIASPKHMLVLMHNQSTQQEPKLLQFLSKQLEMPEMQAETLFNHFVQSIKTNIVEHGILLWDNLGTFNKDDVGNIRFTQIDTIEHYLEPVEATWVSNVKNGSKYDVLVGNNETNNLAIQKEMEGIETKKDYWWIWVLIILGLSAAIVFIKFYG